MKIFSIMKILALLISFEKILSEENINKTLGDENYILKTPNKFDPISYLSKDLDDFDELDKINIDCPVKYIYINNYDFYDISGLLKLSSREDTDYSANFSSSQIIYNFKDLKKTDICNYDEKQIFEISNTCQPLAGAMGDGNTWNIYFDGDGRKIIEIKLNPENTKTSVKYLLKCSKLKNYDINEEKSSYHSFNETTDIILYIETSYVCPTYEYFVLLEWIDYFHYFLGVVFILAGILIILAVEPEFSLFILLYFILFISILSFIKIFFPPSMRFWKIWLILPSCLIFTGILLVIIYAKINNIYLKYVIGTFFGFILGQYFYDLFVMVIVWNSLFFYLLFISLFIIGGVVLSHFFPSITIFLTSSFFGAYTIIRGSSMFGGHFPSEYIITLLKTNGEVGQIGKIINWRFYVYNCCTFVLASFAIILEIMQNRDELNRELRFDN